MYLDFENIFDTEYKDGEDMNRTIAVLKRSGATQMETVMLLVRKLKISLADADSLVVNSEAWKENKDAVEKFRNDFGDYLKNVE
ncbi:hypothetical protein [Chitinophaga arvensicola]|uniref:Uncharacterized protein n=1 Tax=Chitinophaga arvensicola TaxID=29529 RepID=A0A1I0S9I6_9BACT|nr:hypothetical protein [Chitinophaga arvensicola]SEW52799.1 hypothetical protein SAMN04488122_5125 [Chitinophaga arvensicola]